MHRNSVVLPDPLGPIDANDLAGATSRSTPRSTWSLPKYFCTCRIITIGARATPAGSRLPFSRFFRSSASPLRRRRSAAAAKPGTQPRNREADHEVDRASPRCKTRVVALGDRALLDREEEVGLADEDRERGAFEQIDREIRPRCHHDRHRLRQEHRKESRPERQPERLRGVRLPLAESTPIAPRTISDMCAPVKTESASAIELKRRDIDARTPAARRRTGRSSRSTACRGGCRHRRGAPP